MKNNSFKASLYCIFAVITLSLYTIGCADDPSSLGLPFIPDTTGLREFDSYIDTMVITSGNHRYYVNTSGSTNLLVGKNGSYESKGLLIFSNIDDDYDSAVVNSATLKLKYRNYYFPSSASDSLGQISFDIYEIEQPLSFSTVTLDSVNTTTFGNVSKGNYTGSPTSDSQEVDITLNTAMVKDWLEYAADTSYSNKNYGIVFSPGNASNVIKAFYSSNEELRPSLQIIYTKNNVTDTLTYNSTASVSLSNTSITPNTETFSLQAGVSYVQVMKFDLSKIPSTATINDVQLYLTLDSANSVFSNQSSFSIVSQYVSDTAGLKTETFPFNGAQTSGGQYVIRLVSNQAPSPFQRWLLGQTNYGIMIFAGKQTVNLDRYVFYKETCTDPNKRPRVKIKYTPRIIP